MANEYMKIYSTLISREMQVKTMMRCQYIATEVAKIKKTDNIKY